MDEHYQNGDIGIKMIETPSLTQFISENAIVGASGAAALTFLYKIYRILSADRKEDNLNQAERTFRMELKDELKETKEELIALKEENDRLHEDIVELRTTIRLCRNAGNSRCPLLDQFDNTNR